MWCSRLIQKLWNLIHLHWCHECNILHNTTGADKANGIKYLRTSVMYEHTLVPNNLPQVYVPYFKIPL